MFSKELAVLFSSSLLTIILIYLRTPTKVLQQIAIVILAILLILLGRFFITRSKSATEGVFRLILLFLSSVFVQFLVIATGGILSPFLILIHLYTLGASFLLNLRTAIVFFILTILVLVTNILSNQSLLNLLREDPGTTVLYVISFIVIVPLAQFLTSSYHFKDTLSRLLKEYIQLGEKREESILESLGELVFVVNTDLAIISVSGSVEKTLGLPKDNIIGHPLLDIVDLENEAGKKLIPANLSVNDLLIDKTSRIISGFYLKTNKGHPEQVIINMRPVTDSEGSVNQIVFIITNAVAASFLEKHSNIEQAQTRHQALIDNVRDALLKTHQEKIEASVEKLNKIEEDILTALEIEDHSVQEKTDFQDAALICQQIAGEKQAFARSLNTNLLFRLPENEAGELAKLRMAAANTPPELLSNSEFTVLIDKRWLKIAISKLLDIAVLLSSGEQHREAQLTISKTGNLSLNITISTFSPFLSEKEQTQLFQEYYGELGNKTNLKMGSGLEGFIAKSIINQLNLPLEIKSWGNPGRIQFTLTLTKLPR